MNVLAALMLVFLVSFFYYYARQTAIRWFILAVLLAIAGVMSFIIDALLPQYAERMHPQWAALAEDAGRFLLFLCGFSAYAVLLFAIVYSGRAKPSVERLFAFALPLATSILDWYHPIRPIEANDNVLLSTQNAYTFCAGVLLVYSAFKERNPRKRKERTLTSLGLVPPILLGAVLAVNVNIYVSAYLAVAIFIVIFLFLVFRYGVFGIRIVMHRQLLDQTVKGIATGSIMMNHAIKNHATNIQLLTREMRGKVGEAETREGLDLVMTESRQIMNMVRRIQSQIEDIDLRREACDLTALIEDALSMLQLRIGTRPIRVVRTWSGPLTGWCDKVHMQEVFYNILHNAVDAIGDQAGTVTIRAEQTRKHLIVEITDSGEGIAKGDIEKIFDPFFSTKLGDQHFGLGLSYCYLVAQRHGGTIEAISQKGTGTAVTVTLPAKRPGRSSLEPARAAVSRNRD